MDALTLLIADHNRVRGLFERFNAASDADDLATMTQLAGSIRTELEVHTTIEEEIFYPAVRGLSDEIADTVAEGLEEHHQVEVLLEELLALEPGDEAWTAKWTVVIEDVDHHADEEESDLFPKVRSHTDADTRSSWGDQLDARKGELGAPTMEDRIDLTADEVRTLASEQEIPGRSTLSTDELRGGATEVTVTAGPEGRPHERARPSGRSTAAGEDGPDVVDDRRSPAAGRQVDDPASGGDDRNASELDDVLDRDELHDRYYGLLQELRVLLPGVQILVAFLFTVPFASGFDQLDAVGRDIYGIALVSGILAVVAFATPTVFHRVGTRRSRSLRLQWGIRTTRAGLVLLAISLVSALIVVARVALDVPLAIAAVTTVVVALIGLWVVLPLVASGRTHDEHVPR